MPEIKLLDNGMINKIAAGEVVERPASVVKELVENSIDACATAITIEITDGGISYIRITDNGCGIGPEQVKTAFLRHATSKILTIDDLTNVLSLGFRGEALSSIASVSEIEMITKTEENATGTHIELSGGELISIKQSGGADGTTFIMRNLFFNVPARRKFLKKASAESGYVSDIITKIALGHPEIAFKYINNGNTLLQTNGNGDLQAAVLNIYGREMAQGLLSVDYKKDGFHITGLTGKNELSRANRSYGHFYINGRYVKSELIRSVVEECYQTRLPVGKFPVYILNLKAAPDFVDVNVHPTKLEVRFSDEQMIYEFIQKAYKSVFDGQNLIPKHEIKNKQADSGKAVEKSVSLDSEIKVSEPVAEYNVKTNDTLPPVTYIQVSESGYKSGEQPFAPPQVQYMAEKLPVPETIEKKERFFKNYKIIGQFFNTYWMIEQGNSVYYLDQHAAHERVLFEELTAKLESGEVVSQRLASPYAVNLTQREKQTALDNSLMLDKLGFEVEELGEQILAVRSVPYIFNNPADTSCFVDILDALTAGEKPVKSIYDAKLTSIATIACKAAVKANDRLSYIEAKALIERVLTLDNPFTCPHGRPTVVEMTKYEIEKMFKRT